MDQRFGKAAGPSEAEVRAEEGLKHNDYMSMIENMMATTDFGGDDFVSGWKPAQSSDQKDFKGRYYFEKLKLTPLDKEAHWELRKSYVEGLIWCLAYYYEGCISFSYYYPHHFGPMLSDLQEIPKMFGEISFEVGEPLTPFMQLMACLPPASGELVPKLYRSLMLSPESPIIQLYPKDFEVDMNGKK
jgi:5'-3' exonuclease